MKLENLTPGGLLQFILLLVALHSRDGEAVNSEGQWHNHFRRLFVESSNFESWALAAFCTRL